MNRKFLLIGFALILLLAIPLTVYLVGIQTKTTTKAEKNTNLSFSPVNGDIQLGQTFNLGILLDPGNNQISFIKLVISYNKTVLQQNGITIDSKYFPVILEGPTYDQCSGDLCTMTVAASIGTDTTKLITTGGTPTQIGNVSFKAIGGTSNGAATVAFAGGTQALSLATGDAASENVLQTPQSISLTITGVPSPTDSTSNPTATPTGSSGGGTTVQPTTPTSGGTTSTGGTTASGPTCSGLTADTNAPASTPAAVNFNVTGSDTGTITKVTFNFGDGTVQDLTSGGGIGTGNINAQLSHTYQQAGTFTASATLTDNNGNISNPTACSQTINVATANQPTTKGGLPATGPGDTIVQVGIVGAVIAILGGALLLGM